jgi:ribosomal protein S18 acetylase RimI-like enzyme
MVILRRMDPSELARIAEIDRSERVTELFAYRNGALVRRRIDDAVPRWSASGDHEHAVPTRVAAWRPLLDHRGGTLLGAFEVGALAGVAIYRPHLDPGVANLAVLHVSRRHRRCGVASRLVAEVARLARADGARRLYVSATPTGSAVGFYRSFGFRVTGAPNAELFALEPDDIHMVLAL